MPAEPLLSNPKDTEREVGGAGRLGAWRCSGVSQSRTLPLRETPKGVGHTLEHSSVIFKTSELGSKSGSFQCFKKSKELRKFDHWRKNKIPSN